MTVPRIRLNDGTEIPALGYGTWQLDEGAVPEALGAALDAGYRHIDTAHAYGNEAAIGRVIADADIARDELWITSKLWNDRHGRDATLRAFDGTMERLGLDVLDLYLIHWPVPMEDKYAESWQAMVELREQGRIRSIGVSNFEPDHIDRIVGETGVVPSVDQIELHPRYQQRDIRDTLAARDIRIESWSPLGQGEIMSDPTIARIAETHGKSPAQVILRWHLDQGLIVFPKSTSPDHIRSNMDVFDFALDAEQTAAIDALDAADGKMGPKPSELGPIPLSE